MGGGANTGPTLAGGDEFLAAAQSSPEAQQPELMRLYRWAKSLEEEGLCRLYTSVGKERWVLNLRLFDGDSSMVSVWNEKGGSISPYRTVLERRAPKSVDNVEEALAPSPLGQGNVVRCPSDNVLDALREAYREAAGLAAL